MSREVNAGRATVHLGIKDGTSKVLRAASARLKRFSAQTAKVGSVVSGVGRGLMVSGAAMSTPFIAGIKAASNMEEATSKFGIMFGHHSAAMRSQADAMAKALGRSELQMVQMLASSQDLLIPMGLLPSQAREMSAELSTLAVNLASFNGVADEKSFRDIKNAMAGSYMGLRKYGILLDETAVSAELLKMGMDPKAANNAAKAQARLNLIKKGSAAADNDAIRSGHSAQNQLIRLKAELTNLAVAFGEAVLPSITSFTEKVSAAVVTGVEFVKVNKGLVTSLAFLTAGVTAAGLAFVAGGAVLAGVSIVFAGMAAAASALASVMGTVAGVIMTPVGLFVALGAAIASAGVYLWSFTEDGVKALETFKSAVGNISSIFGEALGGIVTAIGAGDIETAFEVASVGVEGIWLQLAGSLSSITDSMVTSWFANVEGWLSWAFKGLLKIDRAMNKVFGGVDENSDVFAVDFARSFISAEEGKRDDQRTRERPGDARIQDNNRRLRGLTERARQNAKAKKDRDERVEWQRRGRIGEMESRRRNQAAREEGKQRRDERLRRIDEANLKWERRRGVPGIPEYRRGPRFDVDAIKQEMLGANLSGSGASTGAFSAAAAGRMSGGAPVMERIARLNEKQTEYLERLVEVNEAERGLGD